MEIIRDKNVSEVLVNLGSIYFHSIFTVICDQLSRAGFLTAFREAEDLSQVTEEPEPGVPMCLCVAAPPRNRPC